MGCYASLGLLGIHQSVCGLDYNINHIRNVATYSFIFSFSYCKLTEFKILSLYNLDSTIISNLSLLVRHSSTKIIFSMNFIHLIYIQKVCQNEYIFKLFCGPDRAWTCDPLIMSQLLLTNWATGPMLYQFIYYKKHAKVSNFYISIANKSTV